MAELQAQIFSSYSQARLENIARTETTAAYNHGLLAGFAQPDSGVVAVQYVSILDARTTDICRARNGLVLPVDSPKLVENTPPLHYQCRSVLSPITEYAMEKLRAGDARYQQRHFGYLDDEFAMNPPKTLDDAMAGWEQAPPPQAGFGQLGQARPQAEKKSNPSIPQAVKQSPTKPKDLPEPVDGGGVGKFPGKTPEEPTYTLLEIGDSKELGKAFNVPLKGYVEGSKEPEFIRQTLELVPVEHVEGISEIRLSHNQVFVGDVEANAAYRIEEKAIDLGRVKRFWNAPRFQASRDSVETLLHEVGHHWHREYSPAEFHLKMTRLASARNLVLLGKKMPNEDDFIARAYALARIIPDDLAKQDPEVYDLLQRYAFGGGG